MSAQIHFDQPVIDDPPIVRFIPGAPSHPEPLCVLTWGPLSIYVSDPGNARQVAAAWISAAEQIEQAKAVAEDAAGGQP